MGPCVKESRICLPHHQSPFLSFPLATVRIQPGHVPPPRCQRDCSQSQQQESKVSPFLPLSFPPAQGSGDVGSTSPRQEVLPGLGVLWPASVPWFGCLTSVEGGAASLASRWSAQLNEEQACLPLSSFPNPASCLTTEAVSSLKGLTQLWK